MYLYRVSCKDWNSFFSDLIDKEILSIGNTEAEAIENAKQLTRSDSRDFEAEKIEEIMGHKITIE